MAIDSQEQQFITRINQIQEEDSLRDIFALIEQIFTFSFGVTTDEARMLDIFGEAHEFYRATTHRGRNEELGDLLSSLAAYCGERNVNPIQQIKASLLKIMKKRAMYVARGDKPNIAIYGLSGDPIHNGHVAAAKTVLDSNLGIQEVYFMLANEYFGAKTLTPPHIRAAMAELLPQIDPRMKYFGYEIEQGLFSETVSTMLKLVHSELAETRRFHFLISVELANSIPNWPRSQELIRLVPFITIPRIGYTPKLRNPWFLQHPHRYIDIEDAPRLIDVSSTRIRRMYEQGLFQEAEALVPGPIHRYILEHNIYRS